MGSMINAKCKCGYVKENMCLGGGMMNFTTECSFPYYCEDCNSLVEANVYDANKKCPECNSNNLISYDDRKICKPKGNEVFSWNVSGEIGKELTLSEGDYLCPDCGKFNLRFEHYGCWD